MNEQASKSLPCDVAKPSLSATKFNMDDLSQCMHCGFCLPACPTFRQTGLESYSPRGRIGLMKGVANAQLPVDDEFAKNMYACLGCRACETACPAGVPYGSMIETAREVIEDDHKQQGNSFWLRPLIFSHLFSHPKRLKTVGNLLWMAQAMGLQKLASKTGLTRMMPKAMAEMQQVVETIASPKTRRERTNLASDSTETKLRVGLFTGCVMDMMYYETNQATARVLAKAGCEVIFIEDQACCGALHAHSGEMQGAVELAKRNIAAFEQADVDVLVNNAGGCGAALKEYHHWFADEPEWRERAMAFVSKVRDANELLMELPSIRFSHSLDVRITYQDSCHLAHGQGIRNQPRELLKQIPGVTYVEMADADQCCGSAGIYNLTNFEMSMDILDEKMGNAQQTNAHLIVTSNPGCLLQMKKGIQRAGLQDQMQAVHIMDVLDQAL